MRRVRRDEILDYVTYGEQRPAIRARAMAAKRARRVHLGGHLTFLFENAETIRYQILEMVRAERIVKEADIQHELDTYNALLAGPGELSCTLLIEIEDAEERAEKLVQWRSLPEHLHARLPDGTRVPARFDGAQLGERKLSSVQYLRFAVAGQVPEALVCDHPDLPGEIALSEAQQAALAEDLAPA